MLNSMRMTKFKDILDEMFCTEKVMGINQKAIYISLYSVIFSWLKIEFITVSEYNVLNAYVLRKEGKK